LGAFHDVVDRALQTVELLELAPPIIGTFVIVVVVIVVVVVIIVVVTANFLRISLAELLDAHAITASETLRGGGHAARHRGILRPNGVVRHLRVVAAGAVVDPLSGIRHKVVDSLHALLNGVVGPADEILGPVHEPLRGAVEPVPEVAHELVRPVDGLLTDPLGAVHDVAHRVLQTVELLEPPGLPSLRDRRRAAQDQQGNQGHHPHHLSLRKHHHSKTPQEKIKRTRGIASVARRSSINAMRACSLALALPRSPLNRPGPANVTAVTPNPRVKAPNLEKFRRPKYLPGETKTTKGMAKSVPLPRVWVLASFSWGYQSRERAEGQCIACLGVGREWKEPIVEGITRETRSIDRLAVGRVYRMNL